LKPQLLFEVFDEYMKITLPRENPPNSEIKDILIKKNTGIL
jgi:hypothetical protein